MRGTMFNLRSVALIATLTAISAFGATAMASPSKRAAQAPEVSCFGLACSTVGQSGYVPEAASARFIDDPQNLFEKPASFYEYLGVPDPDATGSETTVSYVSPAGELDQMPQDVRQLPIVQQLWGEMKDADAVVLGLGAVSINQPVSGKSRSAARSIPDDCGAQNFCLYNNQGFVGPTFYANNINWQGTGWQNLNNIQGGLFNNDLESQGNARSGRGQLARDTNGNGILYCALPNNEDGTFSNNPIDNNLASSFRMQAISSC